MSGEGQDAVITAVGSLKEKSLGAPFADCWMIRLNGENAGGSLRSIRVKTGDDIVVYYGDPTLIQYPEIDLTRMLSDGIVLFTSDDTTTDSAGKNLHSENPGRRGDGGLGRHDIQDKHQRRNYHRFHGRRR